MASDDSDVDDVLGDLLANVDDETEPEVPKKILKELDFNFLDTDANLKTKTAPQIDSASSLVHDPDLDSSDDEDKRNFEEQKYSDSGRELKNLLKASSASPSTRVLTSPPSIDKNKNRPSLSQKSSGFDFNVSQKPPAPSSNQKDIFRDPVFGFRLTKPLVTSSEIVERMRGRNPVSVSEVKLHLATSNTREDWVIAGVLINRSTTKTSQKGSQYCIWKLSDLSEKMNTVSLFLFGGAYKLFWKTTTGSVVGVLNPSVMDSKDDVDQATLSVENAQKVMIFGSSKDMAKCKSTKKNGEPCSNIVNLSRCEFCVFHVKQEYNKASRRADIQSNANGRGFSSSLPQRAKPPPSGIYAQGGQNFVPVFAKRNEKLYQKDSARLALLRGAPQTVQNNCTVSPKSQNIEKKKKACSVELTSSQMKKDAERLDKLRRWNAEKQEMLGVASENSEESKKESKELKIQKNESQNGEKVNKASSEASSSPKLGAGAKGGSIDLSQSVKKPATPKSKITKSESSKTASPAVENAKKSTAPVLSVPKLGAGIKGGSIDFSQPITKKHVESVKLTSARLNAARWVKENCGSLKPGNPNRIKESREKKKEAGEKRRRESEANEDSERATKRAATSQIDDRFKQMMEAKSSHVDLIDKSEQEEQEKYFGRLEMKERMEEKMLNTFKVDCKAVKCLICKYTSFSASDLCKEQRHPLRVVDATKSFFRCSDCGNRTVSLDRIPSQSCNKCSGSHWVRAPMMDEKKTDIAGAKLSIRGGEETFIGSAVQNGNLDLLVPDTGC